MYSRAWRLPLGLCPKVSSPKGNQVYTNNQALNNNVPKATFTTNSERGKRRPMFWRQVQHIAKKYVLCVATCFAEKTKATQQGLLDNNLEEKELAAVAAQPSQPKKVFSASSYYSSYTHNMSNPMTPSHNSLQPRMLQTIPFSGQSPSTSFIPRPPPYDQVPTSHPKFLV